MRTLKAWQVYRICGTVKVWCDTVYFQCSLSAEDVHATIEDDYDYPVIVKSEDIDDVE